MEKMVLLFLAMWLLGSYAVRLRLIDPSLSKFRLYAEMNFLSAPVPAFAAENLKKFHRPQIQSTIPAFIFHAKNTGKILFSPGFKPMPSGG